MGTRFLIVLRHAPYGRLDAAEAVRHLNGAAAHGLEATALLIDDGVYLAKADQVPGPSWTGLSAALAEAVRPGDGHPGEGRRPAVYVDAASLAVRGLTGADLVPGCKVGDDHVAALLLADADATLVY